MVGDQIELLIEGDHVQIRQHLGHGLAAAGNLFLHFLQLEIVNHPHLFDEGQQWIGNNFSHV